jgi:hypothetical protein
MLHWANVPPQYLPHVQGSASQASHLYDQALTLGERTVDQSDECVDSGRVRWFRTAAAVARLDGRQHSDGELFATCAGGDLESLALLSDECTV